MDASEQVGVIFLDLKKAFDRVWHAGLIAKLHAAGVRGQLLAWLTDFLSNRQQQVRVGSAISDCAGLHAGVPQGAVLSPLLFLLYINDVAESVKSAEVNLFADDTSAYILEKKDPSTIVERLQVAANELSSWFSTWLLSINTDKSSVIFIKSPRTSLPPVTVNIYDTPLTQVSSHKHIGLVFNDKLTWSDHTDLVVHRVSSKLGLLRRLQHSWPSLALRTIYLTCIRPSIEYGVVA